MEVGSLWLSSGFTGAGRQGLSFGFHCSLLSYPYVCRLAGYGFLWSDLCSLPFVVLFALVSVCCLPHDLMVLLYYILWAPVVEGVVVGRSELLEYDPYKIH